MANDEPNDPFMLVKTTEVHEDDKRIAGALRGEPVAPARIYKEATIEETPYEYGERRLRQDDAHFW